MEPLATTRRIMVWLCMYPANESATPQQKLAYATHTSVILFFHLVSFVASLVFCVKYVSIDFNGAIFAFMIGIGELGLIYYLIVAVLMRHQIESIFSSLSTIYESSKFNHCMWRDSCVPCWNLVSDWLLTQSHQIPARVIRNQNSYKKNYQSTDENEIAFEHLVQASKNEWLWRIYVKYVEVALGGVVAMSLLSVLYCYLTHGNFDT